MPSGPPGYSPDVLSKLTNLAAQIGESVLAVAGIRIGTEEPRHSTRRVTGNVEIRRYEERIAAETTVAGDEESARSTGFRRLASYIFGGNRGSARIAMTAPVSEQKAGETIAMTAPVAQAAEADGAWTIRFFMPAKWTLDTLPVPNDERVRLVPQPPETVAVLRFSGDRGPRAVATHTAELRNVLVSKGLSAVGEPVAWFYDPPWTLAFRRRNEIAIPIDG